MPEFRRTSGAGAGTTNPFETPRISCTIMGVEIGSSTVMVRDTYANEFVVDASNRPKGMGFPKKDERWILIKVGNRWGFDRQIGAALPPVIDGDRAGMHPVVKQMLNAMASQGLVFDLTTDSDPVPPEPDDLTDPFIEGPGEDVWQEEFYETYPTDDPFYAEAPVPVNATVDDDKVSGAKVASDLLTVASYNQVYTLGTARSKRDLKRLYPQVDLLGMQECPHANRKVALDDRPSNWGMFRPTNAGIGNPILWNSDVLKRLDSGTQQFSVFDGPGTKRPARAVNWVEFEHRATGVVFIYANTHLENAAAVPGYYVPDWKPDSVRHVERFKEQMVGMAQFLPTLAKRAPLILVGDFNVRSPNDLARRQPGLPTAVLGKMGMRSNWDLLGQPAIGTSVGSNSVIDQMYLSNVVPKQVTFVKSKVLRGYYSDHRPVVTRVRIKNFA